MHKKIFLQLVALLAAGVASKTSPAYAQAGFECIDRATWQQLAIDKNGISFNNFILRSEEFLLSPDLQIADLSFSITNRSDHPASLTGQFIFRNDTGEPVLAIAAFTPTPSVAPGQSITANGKVFIEPGTIKEVDTACYQITGNL